MQENIDRYAVMGNPIAHSKSPFIHSQFAKQTNQKLIYDAKLIPTTGFAEAVARFGEEGGKGLNITLPFKQQAAAIVHEHSERAHLAGAVNTIIFKKAKYWYGDNTDGVGLIRDMQHHRWLLKGQRILLLGAGGAVRGIIKPLLDEYPHQVIMANRTISKAYELVNMFHEFGNIASKTFSELSGLQFDIIINGTSASLQNELPPLPEYILTPDSCCYDMMYGKTTPFLQWAVTQGCKNIADGIGMLVEQAAESFYLWRGVRPHTAELIQTLTAMK